MAIDYTALLGLGAAIQVATAHYDFARDGGAVGAVYPSSAIIPSGAIVLGWVVVCTEHVTFAGAGSLNWGFADITLEYLPVLPGQVKVGWNSEASYMILDRDQPLNAIILGFEVTAGKSRLSVFYLPT